MNLKANGKGDYILDENPELVSAIRTVERFAYSISEFERYKRCAYEFVIGNNSDEPLVYKEGMLLWIREMELNGKTKIHHLNKDLLKALKEDTLEALVEFAYKNEGIDRLFYFGLPVRKAKGKWLKNFMLRHFH